MHKAYQEVTAKLGRPLRRCGLVVTVAIGLAFTTAQAGELKILHINDAHSHLKPDSRMGLKLTGESTRVKSGGMPAVVAKFKQLQAAGGNVLKLHAGDAVSGSLFFTLFKGEADAAFMNEVCFDAFALGNHEFNEGDTGLAKFLDFLKSGRLQHAGAGSQYQARNWRIGAGTEQRHRLYPALYRDAD